jgi:uncharacterized protein YlzI (FlbEa/FlbD family)
MMLVELTTRGGGRAPETIWVNANSIADIHPAEVGATLSLVNGRLLTVRETSQEIVGRLEKAGYLVARTRP